MQELRPVPPDPEIIAWLWSPQGIQWATEHNDYVHHRAGWLADIKDDHEHSDYIPCNVALRNCNQVPDSAVYTEKPTAIAVMRSAA